MATAAASKIIRVDPWVRRPLLVTQARDVVRKVLVPGVAMSSKDIYYAALKVDTVAPTIITRPAPAPPVKQLHPSPMEVPHPEHPIRSMTFLKHSVLPLLERGRDVEKVHRIRPLTEEEIERRLSSQQLSRAARRTKAAELAEKKIEEWVWIPVTRARRAQLEQGRDALLAKQRKEEERAAKKPFGWEVGVGASTAHLSKRRQRSRIGKVRNNLGFLKELTTARKEAASGAVATEGAATTPPQAATA